MNSAILIAIPLWIFLGILAVAGFLEVVKNHRQKNYRKKNAMIRDACDKAREGANKWWWRRMVREEIGEWYVNENGDTDFRIREEHKKKED